MSRKYLQALLGAVISVVALAWFISGVEWAPLWETLRSVHLRWVVLASMLLIAEFLIRAVRWRVLLRPLGTKVLVRDLFAAQVIGATVNTLLPFRAGEIAKPLVASRRTGHDIAAVVATAVMERVYDLFGLLSVLLLMSVVLAPDISIGAGADDAAFIANLKRYGGIFGVFAMCCMAIFFTLATRKQAARSIFARIVSISPGPVQGVFMKLFDGFVAGLGNSRDLRGLLQAGLLSLWMWLNGALSIWCLFKAFSMSLPFGAACFIQVTIALAVAIPQAPGFLGVFHIAIEKALILWGQDVTLAKSYAIVFWAVSFVPVTSIGLIALWQEGLSLSSVKDANRQT